MQCNWENANNSQLDFKKMETVQNLRENRQKEKEQKEKETSSNITTTKRKGNKPFFMPVHNYRKCRWESNVTLTLIIIY